MQPLGRPETAGRRSVPLSENIYGCLYPVNCTVKYVNTGRKWTIASIRIYLVRVQYFKIVMKSRGDYIL